MNDEQRALEAIKLLKDWSSWMAASAVAIITFLSSQFAASPTLLTKIATLAFVLSIVSAGWLIGALPWLTINLDITSFRNPYQAPLSSTRGLRSVRVWMAGFAQHLFYVVGVLLLMFAVFVR